MGGQMDHSAVLVPPTAVNLVWGVSAGRNWVVFWSRGRQLCGKLGLRLALSSTHRRLSAAHCAAG